MADRRLQKGFYYRSEASKLYIESRLETVSLETGQSASFIIEDTLLQALTPKNKVASDIIFNNLYIEDGSKITLKKMFEYVSSSYTSMFQTRYSNLLSLVDFAILYVDESSTLLGDGFELHHLAHEFGEIVKRIATCTEYCIEIEDREYYKAQVAWAQSLAQELDSAPDKVKTKVLLQLIEDCWPMLNDWVITYRFLVEITDLALFRDSFEIKNSLYAIIDEVTKEWDKEDKDEH